MEIFNRPRINKYYNSNIQLPYRNNPIPSDIEEVYLSLESKLVETNFQIIKKMFYGSNYLITSKANYLRDALLILKCSLSLITCQNLIDYIEANTKDKIKNIILEDIQILLPILLIDNKRSKDYQKLFQVLQITFVYFYNDIFNISINNYNEADQYFKEKIPKSMNIVQDSEEVNLLVGIRKQYRKYEEETVYEKQLLKYLATIEFNASQNQLRKILLFIQSIYRPKESNMNLRMREFWNYLMHLNSYYRNKKYLEQESYYECGKKSKVDTRAFESIIIERLQKKKVILDIREIVQDYEVETKKNELFKKSLIIVGLNYKFYKEMNYIIDAFSSSNKSIEELKVILKSENLEKCKYKPCLETNIISLHTLLKVVFSMHIQPITNLIIQNYFMSIFVCLSINECEQLRVIYEDYIKIEKTNLFRECFNKIIKYFGLSECHEVESYFKYLESIGISELNILGYFQQFIITPLSKPISKISTHERNKKIFFKEILNGVITKESIIPVNDFLIHYYDPDDAVLYSIILQQCSEWLRKITAKLCMIELRNELKEEKLTKRKLIQWTERITFQRYKQVHIKEVLGNLRTEKSILLDIFKSYRRSLNPLPLVKNKSFETFLDQHYLKPTKNPSTLIWSVYTTVQDKMILERKMKISDIIQGNEEEEYSKEFESEEEEKEKKEDGVYYDLSDFEEYVDPSERKSSVKKMAEEKKPTSTEIGNNYFEQIFGKGKVNKKLLKKEVKEKRKSEKEVNPFLMMKRKRKEQKEY